MSSTVLDKETTRIRNNGDHDKYQHYFKKKDISDNLLEGKPMTALCGVVREGGAQVDPAGLTVCGTCKDIWEKLQAE